VFAGAKRIALVDIVCVHVGVRVVCILTVHILGDTPAMARKPARPRPAADGIRMVMFAMIQLTTIVFTATIGDDCIHDDSSCCKTSALRFN